MTALLAYHNDKAIKRKYMRRVAAHRKADLLSQGDAGNPSLGEKGCAVACTMDGYDHSRYPIELGVPIEVAHIEDAIFEGLPENDALNWPTQFLSAIPVGADLSCVCARFAVWCLTDEKWGATALPNQPEDALECCRRVAALWQRVIEGELQESLRNEFLKEEDRARAGAWAGARAWAGAGAGAGAGARAGASFWLAARDELLRLLKKSK